MKVSLISHTLHPAELCATAAQKCYSSKTREERISAGEVLTSNGVQKKLDHVIKSGHLSVIEHCYFTFEIDGISRVCSHQLVRHRMATFSQESQRYVSLNSTAYVIPATCDDSPVDRDENSNMSRKKMFEEAMLDAWCYYNILVDAGVPPEDARYVLPNACTTNMIMSCNGRELMHILGLRMCNRAQTEIRELAYTMYNLVMGVAPEIFKYSGPNCWFDGCMEEKTCGNPPKMGCL